MAVLVGIDEAGYGPLLGPLVITSTVFRVPDAIEPADLWRVLSRSVAASPARREPRLVIADSKKLLGRGRSLAPLERAALVMLACAGDPVTSWHALIDAVAPGTRARIGAIPWYGGDDFSLPLAPHTGDVGTRVTPVRRDLEAHGVRFEGASSEVLCAGDFNRRILATRNKSVVVIEAVMRLMDQAFRGARGETVHVACDRLGGRTRYRSWLANAFPDYAIHIAEESGARCAYDLRDGARVRHVEFRTKGEDHALGTALAGIFSKYVRECFMFALNRYWTARVPQVRPTAGYVTDARRFLEDIRPALDRLDVDPVELVRQR